MSGNQFLSRFLIATSIWACCVCSTPAFAGSVKKLVVVFQRGGNDGLNTLIPVDEPERLLYDTLRPSIGIPEAQVLSIPGSTNFGLHPALAPLLPLVTAGNMSLVAAVGYPGSERSQRQSQADLDTAVPGLAMLDGWINRLVSTTTGTGLIRAVSVSQQLPGSLIGGQPLPAAPNFGALGVAVDPLILDPDSFLQKARDLVGLTPTNDYFDIYASHEQLFAVVDIFSDWDLDQYVPDNSAVYPSSDFGDRIRHTAQLIKDNPSFLGIEVIAVDQFGYDTPVSQNLPHALLLEDLASSLAAFVTDLGPVGMQDTVILVISNGGRLLAENGTGGTDFGGAGLAMVIGNPTSGGVLNEGSGWPGLGNPVGGGLGWVTDFRDLYWEILSGHLGLDEATLSMVIPGHVYTPIGIIN